MVFAHAKSGHCRQSLYKKMHFVFVEIAASRFALLAMTTRGLPQ
jgi:hypothetical protein